MKQNLMGDIALVIAIALGFFLFMYSTTGVGKGSAGCHLTAKFKNVEGINVGSDVRMSGIKIGSVTAQSLDNQSYDAILTFAADPTIKLPDDFSTAKITSEGLLGGKFIALEPGGSETLVSDGGTITYTQGALDLWALVSDYMFSGKSSRTIRAALPARTEASRNRRRRRNSSRDRRSRSNRPSCSPPRRSSSHRHQLLRPVASRTIPAPIRPRRSNPWSSLGGVAGRSRIQWTAPAPVSDFGHVLAVLPDIGMVGFEHAFDHGHDAVDLRSSPGTRRMAASARWKRSIAFITAISNGVVVEPSSWKPWTWKLTWLLRR